MLFITPLSIRCVNIHLLYEPIRETRFCWCFNADTPRLASRRVASLARSSSGCYLVLHTLRIALVFSSHWLRLLQKSLRVINFPCRVVNHGDARLLLQHGSVARAFPGSAPTSARREGTPRTTRVLTLHVALVYSVRDRWQTEPNTAFVSGSDDFYSHVSVIWNTWHCMLAIIHLPWYLLDAHVNVLLNVIYLRSRLV